MHSQWQAEEEGAGGQHWVLDEEHADRHKQVGTRQPDVLAKLEKEAAAAPAKARDGAASCGPHGMTCTCRRAPAVRALLHSLQRALEVQRRAVCRALVPLHAGCADHHDAALFVGSKHVGGVRQPMR